MNHKTIWLSFWFACVIAGCMRSEKPSAPIQGESKFFLERVRDTAILSLPVHDFQKLSLQNKLLAYYLYQAAIAGRDIHFDQNYRHNLGIRKLCEEIITHSEGISQPVLDDITEYLKLQYLNAGLHGKLTFVKFVPAPRLTFDKFKDAALRALKNGAQYALPQGGTLDEYLKTLKDPIFDPNVDALCTTHSPKEGQDLITGSAVNFYAPGVTENEVKAFKASFPLNSRVARENGRLVEQVWRVGDPKRGIPAGLYAARLSSVINNLKKATAFAPKEFGAALKLLIEFYETGDNKTFSRFNIQWLKYNEPVIDTINGFIEQYRDPMEAKGAWDGTLFFVNESTSGWLREVAQNADYYEQHTPYAPEYKRKGVKPIANMVEVLIETGDGGPISWAGVNLPNEQRIREKYGSKNVLLWNARDAKEEAGAGKTTREFVWPEDQELIHKHTKAMAEILVGFHEALGHASGKNKNSLKGDPRDLLRGHYGWLEEERADLNALHHAWDPKTFAIRGSDWNQEAATALYKNYVAKTLLDYSGASLEEPHAVGKNLAINYFMKKWKVVEQVRRPVNGLEKTFLIVRDENIPQMREAVAELLRELQRIKSEGDGEAASKLLKEYNATNVDPALVAEVKARKDALQIPTYFAYVFPALEIVESDGKPVDVKITFPRDFLQQQMSWSGYSPEALKSIQAQK